MESTSFNPEANKDEVESGIVRVETDLATYNIIGDDHDIVLKPEAIPEEGDMVFLECADNFASNPDRMFNDFYKDPLIGPILDKCQKEGKFVVFGDVAVSDTLFNVEDTLPQVEKLAGYGLMTYALLKF